MCPWVTHRFQVSVGSTLSPGSANLKLSFVFRLDSLLCCLVGVNCENFNVKDQGGVLGDHALDTLTTVCFFGGTDDLGSLTGFKLHKGIVPALDDMTYSDLKEEWSTLVHR